MTQKNLKKVLGIIHIQKNTINSNFNQNVFFKAGWIIPPVMTTQPKTDVTRLDQQSCLGLIACQ